MKLFKKNLGWLVAALFWGLFCGTGPGIWVFVIGAFIITSAQIWATESYRKE